MLDWSSSTYVLLWCWLASVLWNYLCTGSSLFVLPTSKLLSYQCYLTFPLSNKIGEPYQLLLCSRDHFLSLIFTVASFKCVTTTHCGIATSLEMSVTLITLSTFKCYQSIVCLPSNRAIWTRNLWQFIPQNIVLRWRSEEFNLADDCKPCYFFGWLTLNEAIGREEKGHLILGYTYLCAGQ